MRNTWAAAASGEAQNGHFPQVLQPFLTRAVDAEVPTKQAKNYSLGPDPICEGYHTPAHPRIFPPQDWQVTSQSPRAQHSTYGRGRGGAWSRTHTPGNFLQQQGSPSPPHPHTGFSPLSHGGAGQVVFHVFVVFFF